MKEKQFLFSLGDEVIFEKEFSLEGVLHDSKIKYNKGDIINIEAWHFNLTDSEGNEIEDFVSLYKKTK